MNLTGRVLSPTVDKLVQRYEAKYLVMLKDHDGQASAASQGGTEMTGTGSLSGSHDLFMCMGRVRERSKNPGVTKRGPRRQPRCSRHHYPWGQLHRLDLERRGKLEGPEKPYRPRFSQRSEYSQVGIVLVHSPRCFRKRLGEVLVGQATTSTTAPSHHHNDTLA